MKKHKFIGVVVFSICLFTLFVGLPVNALEKGTDCSNTNAKNRYAPEVTDDVKNSRYVVTVKAGSFDVLVTGTTSMRSIVTANNPMIIPYDSSNSVSLKIIMAINTDDDELCNKNTVSLDDIANGTVKKVTTGSTMFTFYRRKDVAAGKVENTNYNGICKAFREGTDYKKYFCDKNGSCSITENLFNNYNFKVSSAVDQATYKKYLNYCFSETVDTNYTQDLVEKMISNVMNIVYVNKNSSNINTNFDQTFEKLWNSAVDTSSGTKNSAISLKCNPFSLEKLPGEDYYTNENRYRKQTVTEENSCRKTCREVVTVQYGPPVASKAGLCFEYKVKIKSKVNCSTEFTGGDMPTMPVTCDPYPVCNGSNGYEDQGGPNEDFDACVNKCDGGKYTQSCINKCYKKVYGSSKESSIMLNYESSPKVRKLYVMGNDAVSIYQQKQQNPGGRYQRDGDTIKWIPNGEKVNYAGKTGDINLNDLAIYYFSTPDLTDRTLAGLKGLVWNYDHLGPYVARDGFKVAVNCEEKCEWKGCEDPNANPNKQEALDEYNQKLTDYINKRNSCSAEASCTTSTAEFKMTVTNKVYDKNKKKVVNNKISFPINSDYSTNTTNGNKIDFTSNDYTCSEHSPIKNSIIIDQGGQCYGCKNGQYDYMTEISFPGTWINNKTGEISYKEKNEETWYHSKNKFCTSLNSLSVNTKWWEWDQVNNHEFGCYSKEQIKNDLTYNISSELKNFGMMSWYFNVDCFYAIRNEECVPDGKNCCSPPVPPTPNCSGSSCVCNGDNCVNIDNYKFRNVKTNNLFPENNQGSTSTLTGRTPGFNWSSGATNLNNKDYEITPTALTKAIQDRQNDIYSSDNKDKYLDYEFVLDKATINKIRNYNKDKKYTQYEGSTKTVNGVIVYSSNLFRNGGIVKADKKGVLGCNNQSGSGNRCETFTDDYVNSLRGGNR